VRELILPLTWEKALLGFFFLVALVSRLWGLGARVMSHDESLHVYYSWLLAAGHGYAHNPVMHGPSLFEFTALMNMLFGASDFSSRLAPVILGIFLAMGVPQLLKPWLGRFGALAASALFLISPYILYFSRYIRHDVQVIAWTSLAAFAILSYLRERQDRFLLLLAAALGLMISTMEMTFFYLAIFSGFLGLRLFFRYRLDLKAMRASEELDLIVVLATLGAFFSAPIALLVLNPLWTRLTGIPFVELSLLDTQTMAWSAGVPGLRLWGLLIVFALASAALGWGWGGRRWLKLAGIFLGITLLLYTSFFTNLRGVGTGFIGSLGYWLSQQDVARGTQPWYYYMLVFPLYEYLPVLGALMATVYLAVRGRTLPVLSRTFGLFSLWWAVLVFTGLTLAGEKMPWLSTHITTPFILLTGWFAGRLLEGGWQWENRLSVRAGLFLRGAALALMAVLAVLTARTAYYASYVNYDYTTEYIDYAHGAPAVKWVLDDLEVIGDQAGSGNQLKVAYDNLVSWPMLWYLRAYTNQTYFADAPTPEALDAPVVIAGPDNWGRIEEMLGDDYGAYEVIRLWWPLEDYKNLNAGRIRGALTDPQMRQALWDILWDRDYTLYAEITGQAIDPPRRWPLADRMRVYVRKDVPVRADRLKIGDYPIGAAFVIKNEYAAVEQDLSPVAVAGRGALTAPRAAAAAPDGSVYVADSGNSRILHFDAAGNLLGQWGGQSTEPAASGSQSGPAGNVTFAEPWGIAVDRQGFVYIADTWNHRIQKFDGEGNFLDQWGLPGLAGEGLDHFWGPRAVAVGSDGRVYVTDTGNKRVVVFDQNGNALFAFGTEGEGTLSEPVGISTGPDGLVYVADTWNRRVAVFSADGEFLREWPFKGWLGSSVDNKPHLSVGPDGRVWVTDPESYRVVVFTNDGTPIASFGEYGLEADKFGMPAGISAAPDGSAWITDARNNRIVQYRLP
jgi:uncharacterized protein (TIGR03663 family)